MVDEQQRPASADETAPEIEAPTAPTAEAATAAEPVAEAPVESVATEAAPASEGEPAEVPPAAAATPAPATAAVAPAAPTTTGDAVADALAAGVARRRRGKRTVPHGQAHIMASFNNTIISITDQGGAVVAWSSGGSVGFKGSRKSTPYAAQVAAEQAARKAGELGVRKLDVIVSGSGSGRDTAIRTLQNMGIEVTGVKDVTPIPHNGCRPKKRKRG